MTPMIMKNNNGICRLWDMIRDRFHTLKDFAAGGRAYFAEDYPYMEKPLKKNIRKHPDLKIWFPRLSARFNNLTDFNHESSESVTRELAAELEIKPGILINGMRTVLTGQLAGPGMFDILVTLGKEKVVNRLKNIDHLFND